MEHSGGQMDGWRYSRHHILRWDTLQEYGSRAQRNNVDWRDRRYEHTKDI
jgi:hypothetical protein